MTVMLAGSDPVLLEKTAATLVEQMKGLKTLVAPRINADINRPEIIIKPRPGIAAELGVTTSALRQTIRIATLCEIPQRTEARRVGKEGVSPCRYRGVPLT